MITIEARMNFAREITDEIQSRPSEEDSGVVMPAVERGHLPETVLDDRETRRSPFNPDDVRTYLRGFENAIEQVDESKYPNRNLEEELLKVEFSETQRLKDIDHSGRGSGCCQAEAGIKKQREAVRWILFGKWGLSN